MLPLTFIDFEFFIMQRVLFIYLFIYVHRLLKDLEGLSNQYVAGLKPKKAGLEVT